MTIYSQYGEERFLNEYFKEKENGFLVDVGAADGELYSNSRHLILNKNWKGILVEPHPFFFEKLVNLYHNNKDIKLLNCAAYKTEGKMPFYVYGNSSSGQVSTLSEHFKAKVSFRYGDGYDKKIDVEVKPLKTILKNIKHIDFLSIDCEGVDLEVVSSNDWDNIRPSLVCIEHSMTKSTLWELMNVYDYHLVHETTGNSFFAEKKL